MIEFSDIERDALIKSIHYWINKWDFECPTLFGLEKSDLKDIAKSWPNSLENDEERTLVACLGSLREMLHYSDSVTATAARTVTA